MVQPLEEQIPIKTCMDRMPRTIQVGAPSVGTRPLMWLMRTAFHIDYAPGVENYPHSGIQSGAPSRPPSRTSQRSGTSSMHVDAPLQSQCLRIP
jgi:hypothetical protein